MIAAVVMVVLTTAVLVTIVSLIVCVAVSKSRRKTSSVASHNVLLGMRVNSLLSVWHIIM